jgi:hypothetical protein
MPEASCISIVKKFYRIILMKQKPGRRGFTGSAFKITIVILALYVQTIQAEEPGNPPGTFYTSWLGNTFMDVNGRKVVTESLTDVCVSPNGIVFTAGYAEAWGGGASFNASDGSFAGRYAGSNTGFGDPLGVCAADNNSVYFGTSGYGILRAAHGGTSGAYTRFLNGKNIQGLYIKNGKLYVSDFGNAKYGYNGSIRILNISTMAEESSFPCASPTRLTVDNAGNIWVVIFTDTTLQNPPGGPFWWGGKVKSFSPDGVPGPEITDFAGPIGIAVDTSGLLLVGGMSENGQIWKYDISGTPTKVGSFGAENGIFGGVAGAFTDSAKLHWVRSIAVDADNSIYTGSCYGTFWGGVVEKWNPGGKLLWRDFAGTSLDCAGIDPDNETEVYSKFHHYSLDYSKRTPGTEWSLKGFTVNRFKYPNDNRIDPGTDVQVRSLGAGAYRIGGKLFVARSRQYGYPWELYRQETTTDGEVLVPSVMMGNGGDNFNHFYNATTKTWYDKPKKDNLYNQWWNIAKNGDIFTIADNPDYIIQYKFGGFDENNNPVWESENATLTASPMAYDARRVYYDSDEDVMYIAGDEPEGEWDTFLKIRRLDNWSSGNRRPRFTSVLPLNDYQYTPGINYGGGMPNSFTVAGDYMFVLYGYGHVRILNKSDGSLTGTLVQDVANGWHGSDGQVDAPYSMTVTKRHNGEYVILFENAAWANIMMQRWCPDGKCLENCNAAIDSVRMQENSIMLDGADTAFVVADIYPDTTCNRSLIWSSTDNGVVKTGYNGTIYGISAGVAYIKATSQGDPSKSDSCLVTVSNVDVSSVMITPSTLTLNRGNITSLTATILPAHALDKKVNWHSDKPSVAKVDSIGVIKALSQGNAMITVTTHNGGKTANCTVIVNEPAAGSPLISIGFNEGTGNAPANTGSLAAKFHLSSASPGWSENVPDKGGSYSVDFGTTTGNYAIESTSVIAGLKDLTSFTITGWVNCRNSEEGGGGNRVVSWINDGGDGVDLVYHNDGSLQMGINQWPDADNGIPPRSSAGRVTTDPDVNAGNWVFFAVSYYAVAKEASYYFGSNTNNAVYDTTIAYDRGAVGSNISRLAIGHFNSATRAIALDRMFRGLMDEIKIFAEALTLNQIIGVQNEVATGISLPDQDNVVLYPNPVKDRLFLSLNADKIIVMDIHGREVLVTHGQSVDFSSLNKGVYIIKYFVGPKMSISKIIKH